MAMALRQLKVYCPQVSSAQPSVTDIQLQESFWQLTRQYSKIDEFQQCQVRRQQEIQDSLRTLEVRFMELEEKLRWFVTAHDGKSA